MATLPTPPGDDLTPEQLFLGHLDLIEAIVGHCYRGSRFKPQEAEDFRGTVMVKLIEDDYAVFRKFQGRSTMKTYLTSDHQAAAPRLPEPHLDQVAEFGGGGTAR